MQHINNNICNMIYTHIHANNKMDKQKKALSKEIDAIIVDCALGEACDEAGLVRLAIEYATVFRCKDYKLSEKHMRSLETEAEQEVARRLEFNVQNVMFRTLRRTTPGLMGLSLLAMQGFTDQPKPARKLMRACECTATKRSPNCKMPVELCKHTGHALAKTIKRAPMTPRTPRSPRTKSASPRTKSASPRTKSASPRTRKSGGK